MTKRANNDPSTTSDRLVRVGDGQRRLRLRQDYLRAKFIWEITRWPFYNGQPMTLEIAQGLKMPGQPLIVELRNVHTLQIIGTSQLRQWPVDFFTRTPLVWADMETAMGSSTKWVTRNI